MINIGETWLANTGKNQAIVSVVSTLAYIDGIAVLVLACTRDKAIGNIGKLGVEFFVERLEK